MLLAATLSPKASTMPFFVRVLVASQRFAHARNSLLHRSRAEAYLFVLSNRRHQLSNGSEDDSELFIVLAFELVQTTREFCVGCEHLPEFHKGSHDLDVNGYRSFTSQYARQ